MICRNCGHGEGLRVVDGEYQENGDFKELYACRYCNQRGTLYAFAREGQLPVYDHSGILAEGWV